MFPYKYSDPNDPDTTVGYIDTTLTSVSQLKSQIDDVNSYYNNWVQSLESSLALIILTDQFTRNVFRGTPRSFTGDTLALNSFLHCLKTL